MNEADFELEIDKRLESIKRVLIEKGKEYRRNKDPFHNFNVGAEMTGEKPFRVLDGFLLKHLISYRDILDDLDNGKFHSKELLEEKFGDIINYFIIQEILIKNS